MMWAFEGDVRLRTFCEYESDTLVCMVIPTLGVGYHLASLCDTRPDNQGAIKSN
jgi:hypothetical protein